MALRYIIFRCIAVVNAHHLGRDALHGLLVTLAIFRRQVTNLLRIWEEILSRQSSNSDNDWMQAHCFARHPSFRLPMFSLTFVPPDIAMAPWGVQTQWSERELTSLLMVMRPSREALQQLLLDSKGPKAAAKALVSALSPSAFTGPNHGKFSPLGF
jgi:hypothetical protein